VLLVRHGEGRQVPNPATRHSDLEALPDYLLGFGTIAEPKNIFSDGTPKRTPIHQIGIQEPMEKNQVEGADTLEWNHNLIPGSIAAGGNETSFWIVRDGKWQPTKAPIAEQFGGVGVYCIKPGVAPLR
jgi:hypothetical protein